ARQALHDALLPLAQVAPRPRRGGGGADDLAAVCATVVLVRGRDDGGGWLFGAPLPHDGAVVRSLGLRLGPGTAVRGSDAGAAGTPVPDARAVAVDVRVSGRHGAGAGRHQSSR